MTAKFPEQPRRVFFAGSFNPFTVGHRDIVDRALSMFDSVVIGAGWETSRRVEAIRAVFAGNPCVEVTAYTGLTVDACRRAGATALLRGVRNAADFEYERNLADINRNISGLETVLLLSRPELAWISSSALRELSHNGVDIDQYLP